MLRQLWPRLGNLYAGFSKNMCKRLLGRDYYLNRQCRESVGRTYYDYCSCFTDKGLKPIRAVLTLCSLIITLETE